MNAFNKLANGIPLEEAAAFFLKLKTAADPMAEQASAAAPGPQGPDETGALEGAFAAPVEQVLAAMGQQLEAELKTNYAYRVYAGSLRDLSHMAIAEHFQEHADDETDHAEWLVRRMTVLGGPVNAPDIMAPPASTDPYEIIQTMIRMEQEGIALWRQLRDLVGEDNPTRYKIEEYLTVEQEHLDELWQLLPQDARTAVVNEGPASSVGAQPQTQGQESPSTNGPSAEPEAPPQKDKAAQAFGRRQPPPKPAPDASPDTGGSDKVAAAVERFLPGTLAYHGAAMKLALATMSPTVFTPNIDLEGNLKEAAAKLADAVQPPPQPAPALSGAAAGQHSAPSPMPALSGPAAGQVAKMAARMKAAFSDVAANAPPPVGGQEHNELQQYLAEEMQGQQQEQEAEQVFYKQKFEQAMQELQVAQQQAQEAQAQVQTLQQQVDMNSQQSQDTLAQAQQIQEAAMQQVNQAHVNATQAMQRSLASSNELLQQQQLAVNMRDAMQQLKTQLMGIAQTQLPPSTTAEAGVSAAAQQMADDQSAIDAQQMATQASAGQENQQQGAQQPGGQDAAANQAGTPAASGDAGTPPTSATPGDSQSGAGSSPNPVETKKQPAEGGETQSSRTSEDSGRSVSVKVGHEDTEKAASDRFIGALAGGLLGAGGTAIESQMSNDPLRAKVKKLEAAEQQGGGFGNAMNLAQAKMRLAMGEMLEKHPVAGSALGGALGAMTGAGAAPHVKDIIKSVRG